MGLCLLSKFLVSLSLSLSLLLSLSPSFSPFLSLPFSRSPYLDWRAQFDAHIVISVDGFVAGAELDPTLRALWIISIAVIAAGGGRRSCLQCCS